MRRKIQLLIALSMFSHAVYADNCDQNCKKSIIEDYFDYLSKVYREGSSISDVDRLFELFHPDVKYEHLGYEANFGRSDWRNAFKRNLKNGAYSAGERDGMRVENYIFGKRHVAVEYSYGEMTENGKWKPKGDQQLMALFGINDDKIVLVREYW